MDDAPLTVAVYLDGYRYHAAPDQNRLADDADKRARLRADGHVVFQLNWDDVNAAAGDAAEAGSQPWHPYQGNAEAAARRTYTAARRRPGRAARTDLDHPGADPVRVPVRPRPRRPGRAAPRPPSPGCCGSRALSWPSRDSGDVTERIRAAAARRAAAAARRRPGHARPRRRRERLPGHGAHRPARPAPETAPLGTWSALAVIDDRQTTIAADGEAHKRRWAAWLYWGNLIQFLADGGGDGAQLAWTGLDDFDPAVLAAAGGAGLAAMPRAQRERGAGDQRGGAVHAQRCAAVECRSPGVVGLTEQSAWADH